ncbi:MAG: hypothetical protein ACI4XN_13755 [Candidatus Kurthia intestinigallinarum]
MMTIVCDVDQVLNNLTEVMLEIFNERYGTSYAMEDLTDFNLENVLSPEEAYNAKAIFNSPDIWDKVKPLPGSQEGLQKLINNGHLVYLVTNNCPDTYGEKVAWIKRYFPFVDNSKIVCMADKWVMKCDVMLDDCYSTLIAKPYYHRILMDYPWNRSNKDFVYDIHRCNDWPQILDVINKLSDEE